MIIQTLVFFIINKLNLKIQDFIGVIIPQKDGNKQEN